jgi:hypothetical protein
MFNEYTDGDGGTVFRHACKLGFEGIVPSGSLRPTAPARLRLDQVKNPHRPSNAAGAMLKSPGGHKQKGKLLTRSNLG